MLSEKWWGRKDVKDCLQSFYNVLLDDIRFTIVGRRYGELKIIEQDVDRIFNQFSNIRYLGFSICGWRDRSAVLGDRSSSVDIEADLDNFPYAFDDLKTIKEWCKEKSIAYVAYFTGSRGLRTCFGKTSKRLGDVAVKLALWREMLDIKSLDLAPYKLGIEGWLQPAGNLHRKSGLPSFVLDDIPSSFEDVFSKAIDILKGDELTIPNFGNVDGDKFLDAIDEEYDKLSDEEKKKVKKAATRFLWQVMPYTYRTRGYRLLI